MCRKKLTESLGQPVVVDNRPGAGGVVGADLAAKSAADGYTLLLCSTGAMAINPGLLPKMPYEPLRDEEENGRSPTVDREGAEDDEPHAR